MSITAQLRDSVRLPGGDALVNGYALESRSGWARRTLIRNGHELEVYDLDELFTGETAPTAVFPVPWPGWDRGVDSVSPDAAFAVFSGQRAVRAVSSAGETLWEYRHSCWGPAFGHSHTGDEQEVCRGLEHGSCRVSDDGRLVWAHVVVGVHDRDWDDWHECWVVLDARDGRELAQLRLDSAAAGSHHVSHPDGIHVGLCIGMGQDGILLYWARWDGEKLTSWDLNDGMDRILTDVHPDHAGFLTVEHYGTDVRLHMLDGTVLATGAPEAADGKDPAWWDYGCGFVDGGTVIATTVDADEDSERAVRHWLLDGRTLEIRGTPTYPTGANGSYVRPLGDGTWLTYDSTSETLYRWSEPAS
ncbi:hypothetical protein [Embleya scabrispora]|uniref:hypothetical protein n=1 Tax=Embleya scabrispora TaxID=159449 RepID=UPI0003788E8A|nr:hypothetical protein [Embleya scabrispora]MYS85449.1 hypothetical protein [Streptomyces sp. SID5474]